VKWKKKRPTGYYRVRVGKEEMRLGEPKGGRIVEEPENDVEPGKMDREWGAAEK
jgi:hypothetical protein